MKNLLSATAAAVVAVAVAAGCSGGGGGSGAANAVTGSVGGQKITMQSAIYVNALVVPTNAAAGQITYAVMSDAPDICTTVGNNSIPPSSNFFFFNLGQFDGATFTPPATTGQYTAFDGSTTLPPSFIAGRLSVLDGSCTVTNQANISAGTVNVTSTSPDIKGKGKNLSMDSGDVIGLNFDFKECPALATFVTSTALLCSP